MVFIACASILASQSPVALVFHPTLGESYRFKIEQNINHGQKQSWTKTDTQLDVNQLGNGLFDINLTSFGAGGGNSDNKPTLRDQLSTKTKSTVRMRCDQNGFLYGAVDSKNAQGIFSWSSLSARLPQIQYPKNNLNLGDTWSQITPLGSPKESNLITSGQLKVTYRLDSVRDGIAKVSSVFKGSYGVTIKLPTKGKQGEAAGIAGTSKQTSVDGTGIVDIELETGIPIRYSSKATYESKTRSSTVANPNEVDVQTLTIKRI